MSHLRECARGVKEIERDAKESGECEGDQNDTGRASQKYWRDSREKGTPKKRNIGEPGLATLATRKKTSQTPSLTSLTLSRVSCLVCLCLSLVYANCIVRLNYMGWATRAAQGHAKQNEGSPAKETCRARNVLRENGSDGKRKNGIERTRSERRERRGMQNKRTRRRKCVREPRESSSGTRRGEMCRREGTVSIHLRYLGLSPFCNAPHTS